MRTHHTLLLTALLAMGCGIEGLYMEIPPYQPGDAGGGVGADVDAQDVETGRSEPDAERDADTNLSAPENVRAESGADSITLGWDAVEGAATYEVRVDQGDWIDVGDATTYEDTSAPAPSISGDVMLTATRGTLRPHVELTATLPTVTEPPTHLASGDSHTCAIDQTGKIYCWGLNTSHQCGHGDDSEARPADNSQISNFPTIELRPTDFSGHYTRNPSAPQTNPPRPIDLQTGALSTCVLYDNGAAVCWGNGRDVGETGDVTAPLVMPIKGVIHKLAASHLSGHYCGIDGNGELLCWGSDASGQLGYGGVNVDLSTQTTRVKLW